MSKERFRLPVAVFMVLTDGKKILSIKRTNTGKRDGMFSVPAGGLENGEDLLSAAIRETKEEIGVDVDKTNVKLGSVVHCKIDGENWINFVYFTDKWQGFPKICEPHKHSELTWFEKDNLPENMLDYVAKSIKNRESGQLYDQLGWY